METRQPTAVVGRDHELAALADWAEHMQLGPTGLLLSGEAGIGKTMVWREGVSVSRAAGATVLVARPTQAELTLGFVGLTDLLAGVADTVLPRIPPALAGALASAILRTDPDPQLDPHAVARGLVEALRVLSEETPLVLAIDDLQWLDAPSARAIAFAARRMTGRASILAAVRDDDGPPDPLDLRRALGDHLREIQLGALSPEALQHMLRQAGTGLSRREMARVHSASGGNPFYAIELSRSAPTSALPSSLRLLVSDRLRALPENAREAVEMAAILGPTGALELGLSVASGDGAVDAAVTAGILVVEDGLTRFSHPLLAAGAYAAIPPGRRRKLHRAAVGVVRGLEERARHVALATEGQDDAAAAVVEEAALAAQARGAPESAAELLAHARRLTPTGQSEDLVRRSVIQADLLYLAGADEEALALIDEVLSSEVDGPWRSRALVHRVQHDEDPHVAVARLEEAVAQATGDDIVRARALAALAWMRGVWAGEVDLAIEEAKTAVLLAESTEDVGVLTNALTTAAILYAYLGDPMAERCFDRALEATDGVEWVAGDRSPFVAFAHQRCWRADWSTAEALLARERALATQNGEDSRLERLNIFCADLELRRGRWGEADRLLEEALAWAPPGYWRTRTLLWRALLRARRGDPAALADLAQASAAIVAGDPLMAATAECVEGLVALADGRAQDAADRLRSLPDQIERSGLRELGILMVAPDAVEALVGAGDLQTAASMTHRLATRADAQRHPLGWPAAALCRGLLALGEGQLETALDELALSREGFELIGAPYEVARTLLVEGNALRRAGRRRAAGDALDASSEIFTALGAGRWVERCSEELRRARPRPSRNSDLTAAERRVALLVVGGQTNREVASGLYTTVATVEAHLTRIYRKAGLRSRTELARAVQQGRLNLEES